MLNSLLSIEKLKKTSLGFRLILLFLTLLFSSLFVEACTAKSDDSHVKKTNNKELVILSANDPLLRLKTKKGVIKIRLYKRVAPKTVEKLTTLINSKKNGKGLYDQLDIIYTLPHIEIRTAIPKELKALKIPKELNANALGLDKKIIKTSGEAMDIWQGKLLKHFRKHKKDGKVSPQLKKWLSRWNKQMNADFLMGVSIKEINEAMSYHYTDSVVSIPVSKGTVLLKSSSPMKSSPSLVIALSDIPIRTGKWVVIGQVTDGLEIAEKISVLPNSGMQKPRYVPVNPVTIEKTEVVNMK